MFNSKKTYKVNSKTEERIVEIVKALCNNKETRVSSVFGGNCYLSLESEHYDIVINDFNIIIANTSDFINEKFTSNFVSYIKTIVDQRISDDIDSISSNIMERKNAMFDRILCNLEQPLDLNLIDPITMPGFSKAAV